MGLTSFWSDQPYLFIRGPEPALHQQEQFVMAMTAIIARTQSKGPSSRPRLDEGCTRYLDLPSAKQPDDEGHCETPGSFEVGKAVVFLH